MISRMRSAAVAATCTAVLVACHAHWGEHCGDDGDDGGDDGSTVVDAAWLDGPVDAYHPDTTDAGPLDAPPSSDAEPPTVDAEPPQPIDAGL